MSPLRAARKDGANRHGANSQGLHPGLYDVAPSGLGVTAPIHFPRVYTLGSTMSPLQGSKMLDPDNPEGVTSYSSGREPRE
jgi:hypothetical protein